MTVYVGVGHAQKCRSMTFRNVAISILVSWLELRSHVQFVAFVLQSRDFVLLVLCHDSVSRWLLKQHNYRIRKGFHVYTQVMLLYSRC